MASPAPVTWAEAADGTRLAERRWTSDGPVRGAVQVVHGLSEHAGRYERPARALTAQGFAVAALDHRGHGLTAGSTGPGGFGGSATSDAVLDDVRDLGERRPPRRRDVGGPGRVRRIPGLAHGAPLQRTT